MGGWPGPRQDILCVLKQTYTNLGEACRIDPRSAVLVGGGGAAGINAVAVGKRLGCAGVLIPETGALLSAANAASVAG